MPSSAQLNANQQNAQKSTGPRSDAGKAASSQNARTHGLAARQFVILPGQQEEFDAFSGELRVDLRPVSYKKPDERSQCMSSVSLQRRIEWSFG